jgi:glycosyltransferase involved in cell wall biosynthesis
MMRVAFVCADQGVPVFGRKGCSIHVQEVARAMREHGARVELFAAQVGGARPPGLEEVRVHELPAVSGDRAARERAALEANSRARAQLEAEGPFDLVYERYSLWSFAAMEYARDAGVPGLLEVNAPLIEEQATYRGLVDRSRAQRASERVFGAASAILAVSEEVASYLDRFDGARGRVHVVPNGVDPRRFGPNVVPALPLAAGTGLTVAFVGTLKPWHGLDTLAEAFALLHRRDERSRLLVVGDGPGRAGLEGLLASRHLYGVARLVGAVPAADVPGFLASAGVGVAPYPALKNFYFSPLKVYEYMAAGLPVVASRVGQLVNLIEHGVNGLLCEPGDPVALAAELDRLRDADLRSRLGRAARATVLDGHTWHAVVSRILQLAAGSRTAPQDLAGVGK